jgi:MFS family permease
MAALALSGRAEVWHVFVIGILGGAFQAVNHPVRHALVPSLVPREDMMNAIALQATGFQLMAVVGPGLAGTLLTVMDVGDVFALIAVLYTLVLFTTIPISVPPRERLTAALPVLQSLSEGFRFIAGHRLISSVMVLAVFPIVFGWSVTTLLPTIADRVLNVGASGYGLLQAALGIGSVVSTIGVASMHGSWARGKLMLGAVVFLGLGIMAFSVSPWLLLATFCLAVAGGGRMGFMSLVNTTLQMHTPDHLRGRVMSVVMLQFGLTMAGGFIAGFVADIVSVQLAGVLLGATCVLAGAYFWVRRPVIRDYR